MQRGSRFLRRYLPRNEGNGFSGSGRELEERHSDARVYSFTTYERLSVCPKCEKEMEARTTCPRQNKSERPWNFRELAPPLF